jgi:hypothetical protein
MFGMEPASKGVERGHDMGAAIRAKIDLTAKGEPLSLTLLELVQAVSDATDSDLETVVAVRYLLETGRVSLCGSFRNTPIAAFC